MPETVILKDNKLFSSTAVDNRFIEEFMPSAPENAVKVYLYGLMLMVRSEGAFADIKTALGLTDDEVNGAFLYWEKAGIIRTARGEDGGLVVQYLPIPQDKALSSEIRRAGAYAELIKALQIVLGTRSLSGAELQKIYDWIEIFGFEEAAAIEIVRHCIEVKGARVHINYMDSVARRLAADGMLTLDSVSDNFKREKESSGGAAAVLKRWHISRRPTDDEILLYDKWTREWGFTDEAIGIALCDVVAVDRPNFKYLDAILKSYHESGSVSPEQMHEMIREQNIVAELARQAFERAGMKRNASAADRRQFEFWIKSFGMSAELILYAAEIASKKAAPFAEMKRIITDWHERGIASFQAAKEDHERAEAERAKGTPKSKSVSRALNYKQRRYTAEELKKLGVDFGEDVYDED